MSPTTVHICTACERPVVVGRSTNQNKVAMRASTSVVFALGRRCCTLTACHWPSHASDDIDLREMFEFAHLKLTVSGRPSKHTHTCAQCSHASVGLAQARPNKHKAICKLEVQKGHKHPIC